MAARVRVIQHEQKQDNRSNKDEQTTNINNTQQFTEYPFANTTYDKISPDNTATATHSPPEPTTTTETRPTLHQLRVHAIVSSVPFIGFGFLDNSMMLIFGDLFDVYLGTKLGISTLASAAMGNTVGDVCGIWLGGTVEAVSNWMGLPDSRMTLTQRSSHLAALAKTIGAVVGILIGCTLGMFPLFWPKDMRMW